MGPPGNRILWGAQAIGDYEDPGNRMLWGPQAIHYGATQYTNTQNTHTHTEKVLERPGIYNIGIFRPKG